jgi:hypothetical protein
MHAVRLELELMRTAAGLAVLAALVIAACGGSGATTITNASHAGAASESGTRAATATVTRTATAPGTPETGTGPVAGGSGGVGLPTDGTGTTAGAPACVASGLALSFLGQQGATGHGELGFALRNTAGSACSTIGYPGVQFLDRAGADLPTSPTHATSDVFGHTRLRALTVGPGQIVSFRLSVTHGEGSSSGCTTAYGLRVIAPNDTATLSVAIAQGAAECATTTVSPLVAGDSAYP